MAEARAQDVVNEAQSMGEASSIDVSGKSFTSNGTGEWEEESRVEGEGSRDSHVTISTPDNSFPESGAIHSSNLASSKFEDPENIISQSNGQTHLETYEHIAAEVGLTNGIDSASFAGSEDAGYQNLVGTDESVTSDTDPNRGEGTEQTHDPSQRRERSNSIKKPASFKAVSVTKNFLAKSGATPAATGKIGGDRTSVGGQSPTTAPSQPAKPRLVAKTGRDVRTLNTVGGVGTNSGPDANKVWNRNRPVPPPPPKQFTDEELKQQYGIHMATRLQADEAGKESKWADIDDDEDDWAPETVQWMDGTKSTLLSSETQPSALKSGSTPQTWKEPSETPDIPSESTQPLNSVSSLGKTILRPGARVATQTKPGLVLKSVPENPAQPEKPQTSSSSKSPWAQLPPVDKASPITFYPPATSTGQPISALRRESSFQDEEQPYSQSPPAREIAADDFDRSWRESGDSSSRELFNSQSGRYEPVKNVRRSGRQDQGFRPPSVLQRPSQPSPAEPSAAFQSRETRSWIQRRDSSSFSGANVPFERRTSIDQETRVAPHTLKPFNPQQSPPKSDARFGLDRPKSSDQAEFQGAVQPHSYSAQAPEPHHSNPSPEEDPRLVQQQLMRERIERNRKRKQEEEAREEAERKERIRLKMEALGPVSPSVSQSKPVETHPDQDGGVPPSELRNLNQPESEHIATTDPKSTVESDAIPLGPESQTQTEALKTAAVSEPLAPSRSHLSSSKSPAQQLPKASLSDSGLSSTNNAEVQLPGLGQPMPTERQARSWGRIPQNMDSPNWPNKPPAQGPSNVWGPLSSDRPLGNGVFENEMNRMPSIQLPTSHQMAPGPLRPPSMSPFDAAHPTPSPPPHMQPRHDGLSQSSAAVSTGGSGRPPFHQPPSRPSNDQSFQRQAQQAPSDMGSAKRAWQNFGTHAASEDASIREQAERDWNAKLAEAERAPIQHEHRPVFRETFRQTVPGDVIGQRRVVSVAKTVHDGQSQVPQDQRSVSQSTPLQQTNNGRASRFFGPIADRVPPVSSTQSSEGDMGLFGPSTPPPPESAEHPVHGAQGRHPLVNIPKVLKVKLPPAPNATTERQEPVQMPPLVRYRSGHQPIVSQIAWQDRFNGLLGRTTKTAQPAATTPSAVGQSANQSPNVPAAPISSSTKTAFVEPPVAISATVSLPQGSELTKPPNAFEDPANIMFETKPTEEELVDEREFGSSPTVRLFKGIHPREMEITSDIPAFHRGLVGNTQIAYFEKANKDFPASANALSFEYLDQDFFQSSGIRIRIRLCGRPTAMKVLPRKTVVQAQLRKPKPRSQPKKQHPAVRGSRPMNGAPNHLQENPGNGNRQASTSKVPAKADPQNHRESRSISDSRRVDSKTATLTSAHTDAAYKPGEGSTGEALLASASEKAKSSAAWAKPPKSQRRQRHNPIRA